MKFMISTEALYAAVNKVMTVTPALSSDSKEILIVASILDNGSGLTILRQSRDAYGEYFIYCSVTEQGAVVVNPDSFNFLQYQYGDMVFELKGNDLVTDVAKIRIISQDDNRFGISRPAIRSVEAPKNLRNLLWANADSNDILFGHVFFDRQFAGVTDRQKIAVVSFEQELPFTGIAPLSILSGIEKDGMLIAIDDKAVWFERGGFVYNNSMSNVQTPSVFRTVNEEAVEGRPGFLLDKRLFRSIVASISSLSKESKYGNSSRCYLKLIGPHLYLESNESEIGQYKNTITVLKAYGDFEISIMPEQLQGLFEKIEGEEVRFLLNSFQFPMIVDKENRYVLSAYSNNWRSGGEG